MQLARQGVQFGCAQHSTASLDGVGLAYECYRIMRGDKLAHGVDALARIAQAQCVHLVELGHRHGSCKLAIDCLVQHGRVAGAAAGDRFRGWGLGLLRRMAALIFY